MLMGFSVVLLTGIGITSVQNRLSRSVRHTVEVLALFGISEHSGLR